MKKSELKKIIKECLVEEALSSTATALVDVLGDRRMLNKEKPEFNVGVFFKANLLKVDKVERISENVFVLYFESSQAENYTRIANSNAPVDWEFGEINYPNNDISSLL